jgi:hypothetical protein
MLQTIWDIESSSPEPRTHLKPDEDKDKRCSKILKLIRGPPSVARQNVKRPFGNFFQRRGFQCNFNPSRIKATDPPSTLRPVNLLGISVQFLPSCGFEPADNLTGGACVCAILFDWSLSDHASESEYAPGSCPGP